MRTRHPRAAGFTLIELLLVISILGLLAAIATGTFFRVRLAQQEKAINEILVRFSTGLERLTKATFDQARQDIREDRPVAQTGVRLSQIWVNPAGTLPTDPDRDRAAGLWAYLKLKSELPQTFDEAFLGVRGHPVSNGPAPPVGMPQPLTVLIPAKPTLVTVTREPTDPAGTWRQLLRTPGNGTPVPERDYALEAAALLRQILTERGVRGELAGDEIGGSQVSEVETESRLMTLSAGGTIVAVTPQPAQTRIKVKVFKDVLGGPITFIRHAQNYDIQATNPNGGPPVDPLDPQARLRVTLAGGAAGWGDGPPNGNPPNVFRSAFLDALRYQPAAAGTAFATPNQFPVVTAPPTPNVRWVTTLAAPATERTSSTRRGKWDAMNDAFEAAIVTSPGLIVTLPRDSAYLYSYSAR